MPQLTGKNVGEIGFGLMGTFWHCPVYVDEELTPCRPDMAPEPAAARAKLRGNAHCIVTRC